MSSQSFYKLGSSYTKHKIKKSNYLQGVRRFKSFFGVTPIVCSKVWSLLEITKPPDAKPIHLLWTLCFLKQYSSEHNRYAIFGYSEKTMRKWIWLFVELIANLDVICWENRFENAVAGQTCFVSLDGIDFKIQEPFPFDRKWFSHKFSGPGVKYEIGICIRTGKIVWKHGGYPCGQYPDLLLAREAYVHCVNENEKTIADRGYKDERYFIQKNNLNYNLHKRIMARHESLNKRIRQFSILKSTFRHDLRKHPTAFHAVLNVTQVIIENGSPLFSV